jgi:hypothetical protein
MQGKWLPPLAPHGRGCFLPPVTAQAPPAKPNHGSEAEAARAARLEREAAALRENLRRRKAQTRARGDSAAGSASAAHESKDIVES